MSCYFDWKLILPTAFTVFGFGILAVLCAAAPLRYPIGQPVPASVYTEPYDPCDPAYKFLQAPPADWAEKFGNNERTMLLYTVSELRLVVANQSKRILALEALHKDPNEAKQ